jgi:hypothetical protein
VLWITGQASILVIKHKLKYFVFRDFKAPGVMSAPPPIKKRILAIASTTSIATIDENDAEYL